MVETVFTQPTADCRGSDFRIQQARKLFEQGRKACIADSQRFAIHAFAEAVQLDPSQRQYAKELLGVLGAGSIVGPSWLATAWPAWRSGRMLSRSIIVADWQATLQHGTALLSLRPQSIPALLGLGQACAALKCFDSALVYLRYAHKLRPHDALVNRHCGRVLGKVSQFDEAVACWSLVRKELPRDEEALRAIGVLTAKKIF